MPQGSLSSRQSAKMCEEEKRLRCVDIIIIESTFDYRALSRISIVESFSYTKLPKTKTTAIYNLLLSNARWSFVSSTMSLEG